MGTFGESNILIAHNDLKATQFRSEIAGKNPLFLCVLASTETAKIPGISAAGKYPEFTDYTPPADAELLFYGKCKCIDGIPVTPEGIPTPALITRSALMLADIPFLVVSGGLNIQPQVPLIELGGTPGADIRTGQSVQHVSDVLERAKLLGSSLRQAADYLVIGESVPGGTTTALGVLTAMGINAKGKVSSTLRPNPHALKNQVVTIGMKQGGIAMGELKEDPVKAITTIGDPMIPAFAGLVLGAAPNMPVVMAGGTQMSAILAVIHALDPTLRDNIAIGTTRWIIHDQTADLKGIVSEITDVPIFAANLNFRDSKHYGLRAYETGIVKEGFGAGGAAIAAMLKSKEEISRETLFETIESNYEKLVG